MAYDFSQGYGNVQGADPLGISVQARGMDRRFNYAQQHPGSSFGPLPNPMWEGLFQALQEQGVDNVVGGNAPNSNAFVGQKQLTGKYGARESGPQGFEPATGELNPIPQANSRPFDVPSDRWSRGAISDVWSRGPMQGLQQAAPPHRRSGPTSFSNV